MADAKDILELSKGSLAASQEKCAKPPKDTPKKPNGISAKSVEDLKNHYYLAAREILLAKTPSPITRAPASAPSAELEKAPTPVDALSPSIVPWPPNTVVAPLTPTTTGVSAPIAFHTFSVYLRTIVLRQLVQATVSSYNTDTK